MRAAALAATHLNSRQPLTVFPVQKKVSAVKGGDLVQVQSLSKRYHASIHHLEPQR